jgi:hypothetical protein
MDEVEAAAVAIEAARVTQAMKERAHLPMPAEYVALNGRVWPQQLPVRDLLGIIDAWGTLSRTVLYKLGVEAWGKPHVPPVKMRGAIQAMQWVRPEIRDTARRSANDAILMNYWGRNKVAYAFHPGLAEALADTTGSDTVPAPVLRMLPHANPLFLFPRAFPVVLADGKPGLLRAFFVTGLLPVGGGNHVRTSSDDSEADGLQLSAFTQVGAVGGKPEDWELSSVSVPLDGRFTVAEAAERSAQLWDADPDSSVNMTSASTNAWTRMVLDICLPALLYACSSEPDVRPEVRPPVRRKGTGKPPRPAKVRELGYRVGPALLAARKAPTARPHGTGTGRTVAAHMRKAHWHTFRFGAGRQQSYVKWLPPISVNPQADGPDKPTVITI